ncbi:MAG: dethiobiotin synthase [Actinomycetia bacterium]|nr:dethiobiotin synthase [Actinomycetes bacterium]MCH9801677.1 dethiobiotin synthase [Actinomycetes bacterium]
MTIRVVTGTSTGVGKTVITAAMAATAAAAGQTVAVVKPAQTGLGPNESGDIAHVAELAGIEDLYELQRFPDPLAPEAAARIRELPTLSRQQIVSAIAALAEEFDLVLVEGAGGLLVRFDEHGTTLADIAEDLASDHDTEVVVVADPALGTLNHTALTVEALQQRKLHLAGVVLGSWPLEPDLACQTNLVDLQSVVGAPISGAMLAGAGELNRENFLAAAESSLSPAFGGRFDEADFAVTFQTRRTS